MTTVHYRQPPQPVYPPQARRLGEQGQVRVKVRVAIDGIPGDAVVVESSGSPRLDQAAVQAVLAARFEPLRIDGRPQAALAIVPIHFSLQ
jgi:protein TonB